MQARLGGFPRSGAERMGLQTPETSSRRKSEQRLDIGGGSIRVQSGTLDSHQVRDDSINLMVASTHWASPYTFYAKVRKHSI